MSRNVPTTDKAKAFLNKRPTFIGRVCEDDFYEHPILGDESPLVIVTPSGEVRRTPFWELPSTEEYTRSY